jgi:probable rRNA maturation factor
MMLVEADASGDWDSSTDWAALADKAVRSAIEVSDQSQLLDSKLSVEVSVRLTNDAEVRALNAAWRGKDKATNVLSFPMTDAGALRNAEGEALLGDVVLAFETSRDEAADKHISLEAHAAHLVVHGTLHLLGYDHEQGDQKAEEMELLERRALASLGIADPYLSKASAG